MAKKKPAPVEQGPMLLALEPESMAPAAPAPRVQIPAPRPAPGPAAGPIQPPVEAIVPARNAPAPETGDLAEVVLDVKDNLWTAQCIVVCPDGELLDSFEASGVVTADGVTHPGWLLAACEAMRRCIAMNRPLRVELNLLDHRPVGFLMFTLNDRVHMATWDKDTREKPWPDLYQEFLDLKSQVKPRIRWKRA